MIFQDLVNQIKSEARIKEDSSFDSTVIALINELFKEAVESQRPFELRNEVIIPITVSGETLVPLPVDFFLYHQVFYKDIDTGRQWQLSDEDKVILPAPRGLYGYPKSFQIAGTNIVIKPKDNVIQASNVYLIYYKKPPEIALIDLINPNPIPRLEPFLIRACIRRLRFFHSDDIQVAQMLTGDISSAAQSYANDEPEKKQ